MSMYRKEFYIVEGLNIRTSNYIIFVIRLYNKYAIYIVYISKVEIILTLYRYPKYVQYSGGYVFLKISIDYLLAYICCILGAYTSIVWYQGFFIYTSNS